MTAGLTGLAIGVSAFIIIGIFHPIVIKTEYYTGTRLWCKELFEQRERVRKGWFPKNPKRTDYKD